jgi:hypothetical protein
MDNVKYNLKLIKYFEKKNKQQANNWVMITIDGDILYGQDKDGFVYFSNFPPIKIEFIDQVSLPSGNIINILKTYPKPTEPINQWAEICELDIRGSFAFKSEWIFSYLDIEKLF